MSALGKHDIDFLAGMCSLVLGKQSGKSWEDLGKRQMLAALQAEVTEAVLFFCIHAQVIPSEKLKEL